MTLDYLVAKQGDVCVVINKTCCTYVNNLGQRKLDFPGGASGKESACWCRRPRFNPCIRSPRVGNGNFFQDSCPENSMDSGAWQAIVHGATKSQTQLSTYKMGIKKISEQASWLYQYHWGSDPNTIRSTIKGALCRLTWFPLFLDPIILIFLLLLFGPFMFNPWVTFMFFRLQQYVLK